MPSPAPSAVWLGRFVDSCFFLEFPAVCDEFPVVDLERQQLSPPAFVATSKQLLLSSRTDVQQAVRHCERVRCDGYAWTTWISPRPNIDWVLVTALSRRQVCRVVQRSGKVSDIVNPWNENRSAGLQFENSRQLDRDENASPCLGYEVACQSL